MSNKIDNKVLATKKKLFIKPDYIKSKIFSNSCNKINGNINNGVNNKFVLEKKLKMKNLKRLK